MRNTIKALLAASLAFLWLPVHAAPVAWTIDSLLFDDGGAASGSFVYDADANIYSDISVVTTAGSVLSGSIYSFLNPSIFSPPNPTGLALVTSDAPDLTGTPGLGLTYGANLTNAGGTIQLIGFAEASCSNAACNAPTGISRDVLSGQISAVPIPAAVWLFGSGLGLLGWLRHKRKKR